MAAFHAVNLRHKISDIKSVEEKSEEPLIKRHQGSVGRFFPRFRGLASSSNCFDAIIKI
jgi:hypothetical protein